MHLTSQSLGCLVEHQPSEARLEGWGIRPPEPPAIGQLVGLSTFSYETMLREAVPIHRKVVIGGGRSRDELRGIDVLVSAPGYSLAVESKMYGSELPMQTGEGLLDLQRKRDDVVASRRLLRYRREAYHYEPFQHSVRELTSPLAGGEATRSGEEPPYANLIRSLIEREQIGVARRMLDAIPASLVNDGRIARLRRVLGRPELKVSARRDTDRSREYQWIRDNKQRYHGRWVALGEGRLLAEAGSLRELLERLKSLQPGQPPLLHHIQ